MNTSMNLVSLLSNRSIALVATAYDLDTDVDGFSKFLLKRHRVIHNLRHTPSPIIISIINVTKLKILRARGKMRDLLHTDDILWLITEDEWKAYQTRVLPFHSPAKFRHGKNIACLHPSGLSSTELKNLIKQYWNQYIIEDINEIFKSPFKRPHKLILNLDTDIIDTDIISASEAEESIISNLTSSFDSSTSSITKKQSNLSNNKLNNLLFIHNNNKFDILSKDNQNFDDSESDGLNNDSNSMSPVNINHLQKNITPLTLNNINKYSISPNLNNNNNNNKTPLKSPLKSASKNLINNSANLSLTSMESIGKKNASNNISNPTSPNKKNSNTTNIFALTSIEKSNKLNYVDIIENPSNKILPILKSPAKLFSSQNSINKDVTKFNFNNININSIDDAILKLEIELESRLELGTKISSPENVYKVVGRMLKLEKNKIEFKNYNNAAIKIQSITRGKNVRSNLVLLNQCAMKIQNYFRMKICLNNYLRYLYDLKNIEEGEDVAFINDELNDDEFVYKYKICDDDIEQKKIEVYDNEEEVIEIIRIEDSSEESIIVNEESLQIIKDEETVVSDNIIEDDLFEEVMSNNEMSDKEVERYNNIDNMRESNNNSQNSIDEDKENVKYLRIQSRQYNSRQPMRHRRNTETLFSSIKSCLYNEEDEKDEEATIIEVYKSEEMVKKEIENKLEIIKEGEEKKNNIVEVHKDKGKNEIENELAIIEKQKEQYNIIDMIQLKSKSARKSITPVQLEDAIIRIQKLAIRRKTRYNDMQDIVTFSTVKQINPVTPSQLKEAIVKIQVLSERRKSYFNNKEEKCSVSNIGQFINNNNEIGDVNIYSNTNLSGTMLSPIYKSNTTNSTVELISPQAINAIKITNIDDADIDDDLIPPPPPLPIFQLQQEQVIKHETAVKKLVDELNQERTLRNELEIRLQETRMLLKILATGNSNRSNINDISSIDELESSLEGVAADFLNSSREITRKSHRRSTWNNNFDINIDNNQSDRSLLSTSPIKILSTVVNSQIEKESTEIIKSDTDILVKEKKIEEVNTILIFNNQVEIEDKNENKIFDTKENQIKSELIEKLDDNDNNNDSNLIKLNKIQSVSINDVDSKITTIPFLEMEPVLAIKSNHIEDDIEKESIKIIKSNIDVLIKENLKDEVNNENNINCIDSESFDNISIQSTVSSIISTSKPKRKSNLIKNKSLQKRSTKRASSISVFSLSLGNLENDDVSELDGKSATKPIEDYNSDEFNIKNDNNFQSEKIVKVITEKEYQENDIDNTKEKKIGKSPLIKFGAAINSFKLMFAQSFTNSPSYFQKNNCDENTLVDDAVYSPIVNDSIVTNVLSNELSSNKEIKIDGSSLKNVFYELTEPNLDLNIKASIIENRNLSPFTIMENKDFRSISDAILIAENVLQQSPMKNNTKVQQNLNKNENNIPIKSSNVNLMQVLNEEIETISIVDSNKNELFDNSFKPTNLTIARNSPQNNIEKKTISSDNNESNFVYPLVAFYWPFIYLSMNINNENVANINLNEKILWTLFQLYGTKIDTASMSSSYIRSSSIIRILNDTKCLKLSSLITTFTLEAYLRKNPFTIPINHNDLITPRSRSQSDVTASLNKSNSRRPSFSHDLMTIEKKASSNYNVKNNAQIQLKSDGIKLIGFEHFQFIFQNCIPTMISNDKNHKGEKNIDKIYEKLIEKFKNWISVSTLNKEYDQLLKDSVLCISGIILPYKFNFDHTTHIEAKSDSTHTYRKWKRYKCKDEISRTNLNDTIKVWNGCDLSLSEIESIREIWEINNIQIQQIFKFYSIKGHNLLINFENCHDMLVDFNIIPSFLDLPNFAKLFRSCKFLEWYLNNIISIHKNKDDILNYNSIINMIVNSNEFIIPSGYLHFLPYLKDDHNINHNSSYQDILLSIGNNSLSLTGFVEFITRIACFNGKLSNKPIVALGNLLRLMNLSSGKDKIMKANRKSMSIRDFVIN